MIAVQCAEQLDRTALQQLFFLAMPPFAEAARSSMPDLSGIKASILKVDAPPTSR